MQKKEFLSWFTCYQQQALILHERRLIVLVGDNAWASTLLKSIEVGCHNLSQSDQKNWLVYGERQSGKSSQNIKPNVTHQGFRDKLGSESHFVVFQDKNLSIDALAALSGTLVAGGILFILLDDKSIITNSPFNQRFFKKLADFEQHKIIEQDKLFLPILNGSNFDVFADKNRASCSSYAYNCLTQEQVTAVDAVIKVVKGKRNQPLVLTADRGRGKSSSLAIACGQLLNVATKDNVLKIVITAIDLGSLSVFFRQLMISLPTGQLEKGRFSVNYGFVEFMPVDQLIKHKPAASLVLVDEAAAIPIYLLEHLLAHHSRLVFASTIHGYEGAGRGFTLKFQKTLAIKYPQWRSLHIRQAIRWRDEDPLEALIFDACLLNAELPLLTEKVKQGDLSVLLFKQFSADELLQDEALLKQVFSVLVLAHYQTKPSDVKILLDNNKVQLVCLLSKEKDSLQVIAVALLMTEGSVRGNHIDTKEVDAVNHSKKRLKNHFVPQSLLTQCGIEQAFDYHYIRVMRIAIHPQMHHQGIGSYFLEKITTFSKSQGTDFLAASFGATTALLSFWLKNNFQLARIGFTKDKASGEQSALVLKALSTGANTSLTDINTEFYRSFDYLLTQEYKELSAELVLLILQYCPQEQCLTLSVRDNANVKAFAQGYRQYSACVFSLHLWLKAQLSNIQVSNLSLSTKLSLLILISRIMQKHSISDVCNMYAFTGKKDLENFLKSSVQQLLIL